MWLHSRCVTFHQLFAYDEDLSNEIATEFERVKKLIVTQIKRLGYCKVEDRIIDAGPRALGGVLVQYDSALRPRITTCVAHALSEVESCSDHNQRRALAVVWVVERLQYFLLDRHFTLFTDNKSVEFIFGRKHFQGSRACADCLSRLVKQSQEPSEAYQSINIDCILVSSSNLRCYSSLDDTSSSLFLKVLHL